MHSIDEFGLGKRGRKFAETPDMNCPTMYRPEAVGTAADGTGKGSCSFAAKPTMLEAKEQIAILKADPANAQYDQWYVVEYKPVVRMRIVWRSHMPPKDS